jgi:uncharacterized membrane protein YhhN
VSRVEVVVIVVAAVLAPVNWLAVARRQVALQRTTKPAVLGLLALAAVVAPADDPAVQVFVVLALLASLAGDVALMLSERWFIVGLASFLVAHVLYAVGVLIEPDWSTAGTAIGLALGIGVLATLGVRLDRSLGDGDPMLRLGVRAYVIVILAMLVAAWSAGPLLMAFGAASFVASDSLLGWNRFVGEDRRLQCAVMPTYHVGQFLIALGLLHQLH